MHEICLKSLRLCYFVMETIENYTHTQLLQVLIDQGNKTKLEKNTQYWLVWIQMYKLGHQHIQHVHVCTPYLGLRP